MLCTFCRCYAAHEAPQDLCSRLLKHSALAQDGYPYNRIQWVGFNGGLVVPGLTRRAAAAVKQREQAQKILQQLQAASSGQLCTAEDAAMANLAQSDSDDNLMQAANG